MRILFYLHRRQNIKKLAILQERNLIFLIFYLLIFNRCLNGFLMILLLSDF